MINNATITMSVSALYLVSLYTTLSFNIWSQLTAVVALINVMSIIVTMSFWPSLAILAASYFGQDLSHIITCEPTFQGSYQKDANFWSLLAEHTYFLLPLVLDSVKFMEGGTFTTLFVARNDVLRAKADLPEDKIALAGITEWVMAQNPPEDRTTHWWYAHLPDTVSDKVKSSFDQIATSKKVLDAFYTRFTESMYTVEVVHGMNEIYVASKQHNNDSDKVFYMNHVDGPLVIYPFVRVYRCLIAINRNVQIETVCPQVPDCVALSEGDMLGIDFHREVHRIRHNPNGETNDGMRVTLKVHYVVYPKCMGSYGRYLGKASTLYNQLFRLLFLTTIQPTTFVGKFLAALVIGVTDLVYVTEEWMGWNNVAFTAFLIFGNYIHPQFFLAATSFIHYMKYIATYYYRDVAFGRFKRDVVFFKILSISQLAYHYFANFELDLVSLGMIAAGYTVATMATAVIGIDRTYFGSEMGFLAPKWINKFPYGTVPHPMIVGALTALAGFYKMEPFRAAFPYLVPVHMMFYAAHCLQEIYDVHAEPLPAVVQKRLASFEKTA
jgi:hypothetical protein